jgi:murein DD-endopeptidase MepM/ murein hydrolase activator NlpD
MISLGQPLDKVEITQEFGKDFQIYRDGKLVWFYKDLYGLKGHIGIDYKCNVGTPVKACNDGVILYAGYDNINGNLVQVWNEELGFKTLYGHNSVLKVKQGDIVKKGDIIALSGNTGDGTGPHLHLGFKLTGQGGNGLDNNNGYNGASDPMPYFNKQEENMKLKKIKGQKDIYLVDDVKGTMTMIVDVETLNALGGEFEEVDNLAGYIPKGTLVYVERTIN